MNLEELLSDGAVREAYERQLARTLEAERGKWEQETNRRVSAARAEGERVAGLSAEERLRERENALTGRERDILRRELRAEAVQVLVGRGLPGELADALNYEDRESCERSIEQTDRVFRAAVQAGISQRLGQNPPQADAGTGDPSRMSDEQYYAARMKGRR